MSKAAKVVGLAAVVLIAVGVFSNWYRIDFSRALNLVQSVSPTVARILRDNSKLASASQALGLSGLQTTGGLAALIAAGIGAASLLLVLFSPAGTSRSRVAGMVAFGSGILVLGATAWSVVHKPDASQLIDRVSHLPVTAVLNTTIKALAGIGGSSSLGSSVLYSVGIGSGVKLTLLGGAVLAASGLALAVTRSAKVASTAPVFAQTAPSGRAGPSQQEASMGATTAAPARYCSACGSAFSGEPRFCPECGASRG